MAELPTGTVTFLFSDIEGSTRLVQALGDRYGDLLAEHCRIIRDAIAEADGTEVATDGDSFFAVFPSPSRAAAAAVAAQRGLAAGQWPDGLSVRVRVGLHTGEGRLGGDNYIGLDVHRAARIAAAGHGGQVLLSDTTRALVSDALPTDVRLRDLGLHRLKDLARPERLTQLDIDGLPVEFPALRTLDARPNNLPIQLTSFVGRDAEIEAVIERLDRARLVTLTGPGGTGKTRLALQVASECLSRYEDGSFFVELAPITEPSLVPSTIAAALGVREANDRPIVESLKDELRDRERLIVLDNFEQVAAAAPLATELLAAADRVRILVTSRALLRVHGEQEYPVPPLRVPDPASLPSIETLSQYEAVTLFVERAMAARPDFAVTNETAPAVAEIVGRLDGLPLAIELAAAKTRLLDPPAILGRLGSRLAFLAGGPRDLPARQQTLRHAIDWSHELLDPAGQVLMRRLSVFMGGWTVEAVEAVCDPAGIGVDAFDGLSALADQSLVRIDESAVDETRFTMLETIREYAVERLAESGEADTLRRRHAEHVLALAEAAEPELTRSPEAIERLGRDHDNIRAALAWAIETGAAEIGLRLGFAVWRFWHLRGRLREGRDWFDRLLALPDSADRTVARARGLTGAAGIAYWQNDYPTAEAWYDEAESIFREQGDLPGLTDALFNTGSMAAIRGDMDAVQARFLEGLALARELGDDRQVMRFLEAEGYAAFMVDDLDTARPILEESLEMALRTGTKFEVSAAHHTVGQVARLQGRFAEAAEHYRLALRGMHELGDAASLTEPLQGLAAIAVATGDPERGIRLLGANAAIRDRLGGGPPPEWLRLGDPLGDARAVLDEATYDAAWGAGFAFSVDEAVADALAVDVPPGAASLPP